MARTMTFRVRGKVTGTHGGQMLMAIMMRKGDGLSGQVPGGFGVVQQTDGSFEIRNTTPGSYLLGVRSPAETTAALAAPVNVEVTSSHIDGLEIKLGGGGGTLSGRVTFSPSKPAGAKNPSIRLELADYRFPAGPGATAGDDGRFTLKGVFPGRYRMLIDDMPEGAYLKSVRLGGQEADETGMEIGGAGELEIALSNSGAEVEGVVLGPEEKPAAGVIVALIPASGRESHYRTMPADHDGTFRIKGVAPGIYIVLAWEDIEPGAHRDPEFVKPFEAQAQRLALEENGAAKLKLKAIPFESR
jgi:hypothetical protein